MLVNSVYVHPESHFPFGTERFSINLPWYVTEPAFWITPMVSYNFDDSDLKLIMYRLLLWMQLHDWNQALFNHHFPTLALEYPQHKHLGCFSMTYPFQVMDFVYSFQVVCPFLSNFLMDLDIRICLH